MNIGIRKALQEEIRAGLARKEELMREASLLEAKLQLAQAEAMLCEKRVQYLLRMSETEQATGIDPGDAQATG